MDKSENESMVGTCDSHKMLTLPVAPFVLDRSLDPSFHGSLDTHFTAWEDKQDQHQDTESVFSYSSYTWYFGAYKGCGFTQLGKIGL